MTQITEPQTQNIMKRLLSIRSAVALSATILLFSCSKKQDESVIDTSPVDQESVVQVMERAMQSDIDMVSMRSSATNSPCNPLPFFQDCVEITNSGEEYPREITLDYGDGCEGPNGNVRSGIIIINISNPMFMEGAVRTVTFDGFAINGHAFAGSRVMTNTGVNDLGNPTFSRDVDMVISLDAGDLSRIFQLEVEWLEGYDTDPCFDNVFLISGEGTVIRPNDSEVNRTILEPLLHSYDCPHYTAGVVELETNFGVYTIDFGDGTCDNVAVVTSGDESWEITL